MRNRIRSTIVVLPFLMLPFATAAHAQSGFEPARPAQTQKGSSSQAPMAAGDIKTLYRFSGVRDGVTASWTVGTAVMCSNHTGQPIDARIRIYGAAGTLYANVSFTIEPNATYTAVTRPIPAYQANRNLGLGAVSQGMGVVQSSHEGLVCSAQVVDAEALPPTFMSGLNMERFER